MKEIKDRTATDGNNGKRSRTKRKNNQRERRKFIDQTTNLILRGKHYEANIGTTVEQRLRERTYYFPYRSYRRKKVRCSKSLRRAQEFQKGILRFGFRTSACGYARTR